MDALSPLLSTFFTRSGTTESEIKKVEDAFNCHLPSDYRDFMLQTNGGEGFLAEGGYLELTATEDLVFLNLANELDVHMPEFLLIGSDGGGMAYVLHRFDHHYSKLDQMTIPFPSLTFFYGKTFLEFLTCISKERWNHSE